MIPKIRRILYATDLSENAKFAFSYAADLAYRYDAKLTILSVMESLSEQAELQIRQMMGNDSWERLKDEKQQESMETIKSRVQDFCNEMEEKINTCNLMADDIQIRNGIPYEEILKTAGEVDADMIVMGTHGYNALQDSLIGGTARRIVKDSKIPVMVVRLPEEED